MASAIQLVRTLALAGAALLATQASAEAFNGFYVGAQAGWQQDAGNKGYGDNKGDGFAYGGFLGYNFNINGNGIIGVEASLNGTTGNIAVGADQINVGTRWDIVGRAGALISPKTLVYARGGWTQQKYTLDFGTGTTNENRGGFTIGAGVEQAVTPNVTTRLQYDYAKYSDFDGEDFGAKAHAIRVGVAYNF